jgi:hypothetical protein
VGSQELDLTFRVLEVKAAIRNRVNLLDFFELQLASLAAKPLDLAFH